MKKYLQISALCLVVLAAGIFSSCKDDESGSSSPLLGMSVQLAAADSTVSTRINIDHANRPRDRFAQPGSARSESCSLYCDLVSGASLYTPRRYESCRDGSGDVNRRKYPMGDNIVAIRSWRKWTARSKEVKASYGGVEAVTSLDKKSRLINVYFGSDPVDFTQVPEFVISAIVDGRSTSTNLTMDLSADTAM